MHRTTIMVSDDLSARLRFEAGRRGVSVAQVARELLETGLAPASAAGRLSFFGVGAGGSDDASEHVDDLVGRAITRRIRGDQAR